MLSVEEALEATLAGVARLPAERVALAEARGRVLAEDVFADTDQPPFDNAAVDGYAVRAADTAGASAEIPCVLESLGEAPAGTAEAPALRPGACVRVMTGGPMPRGADAMVMVEDTRSGGETEAGRVQILAEARSRDHVRYRGESIRAGARTLAAGTLVGPAEVALLASCGQAAPLCVRRPRVAVFSTGDELVDAACVPGPGQIRDTNRYTLAALVGEAGAELHSVAHVPDDAAATEAAFRRAAGMDGGGAADVIITSGGVSVGDRDYVKPVLDRLGSLELWRVRMKPGKPVAFGRIGPTLFFGLPGNPVSTMVTFELFARPALLKMAGRSDLARPRVRATLAADVEHVPGRREYVRAHVALSGSAWRAEPTGAQGSSLLLSMVGANAYIIVPEEADGLRAGETVEALLLGPVEATP